MINFTSRHVTATLREKYSDAPWTGECVGPIVGLGATNTRKHSGRATLAIAS